MRIVKNVLLGLSVITLLTASRCSSAVKGIERIKESTERAKESLERLKKDTKRMESLVNESTQKAKKYGNQAAASAAENPNIQRGVYAGSRTINNATRSSAQTTSQPRMVSCPRCYGRGNVQGNDGYVYCCSRCNGTGTIFVK